MYKRMVSIISLILLFLLCGFILASCGGGNSTPSTSGGTDGQSLMQDRCSVCHSVDRITSAHKTLDQWTTTVDRMINHGAQLNATEQQTLIDYLAATYK
jgi:mono/diheme cytochrome c family protein